VDTEAMVWNSVQGKRITNLECSLIIAIHHSATAEKFNTICKANDNKRSVDDL
jgi:hypothetical protein